VHPGPPASIGPDHQLPAASPPAPPAGGHKTAWIVGTLVVLLVASYLIYRWYEKHEQAQRGAEAARAAAAGIPITTATAQKGNIGVYLDSIGTVTPVYSDAITSQVNGLITAVHYKEGQLVHKGDPLIDIDARPYQATLEQAQGALERDQNLLGQAQMDLKRYQDAWARNAIAKQQMDDQAKIVLQDEGTVKNDEGTVHYDQVQVDFCHITSTIDGRVGLRLVDPGNVVQASSTNTLVVVTQLQPITVVFTIPEDNLGAVQGRLLKGAKLSVDAYDRAAQTKIASGALLTIDNQIDTTTGTVKGRAQFDNKDYGLFPNEFVNTRLLVNTLQGVTLAPSSTIQQNGQSSFVYVIQDNVAHQRSVKPGVTDNGMTQVDGVNPGDVLANSTFDRLQNNSKVEISTNGQAPAPPPTQENPQPSKGSKQK
jgi:membrane fusion protein, multidrug efflux system